MSASILSKLAGLNTVTHTASRTEMTPLQFEQCKAAIQRDNRGFNVHPNKFDLSQPYRVSLNFQNDWNNFGNFTSPDVAAAVGSIVSLAYFGAKAKKGTYDEAKVDGNEEFIAWLADKRNAQVIAKANGDTAAMIDGGSFEATTKDLADPAENPF